MESTPRRTESVGPAEETALVRAAQSGDAGAFTALVRLHQRGIHRVAYGLTRNAADADDLAQETFVRAWRALDTFRAGEPLWPWLSRICVNLAYSLFRHRRRRPEAPLEPLLEAGMQWAGEDDPVENVTGHERAEQVRAAFEGLSEEHRQVLVLRVVQGMTYEEIARTLNVPAGTVMSRLSRARADLRARMGGPTGEEA